jgi:hypothetical protein
VAYLQPDPQPPAGFLDPPAHIRRQHRMLAPCIGEQHPALILE